MRFPQIACVLATTLLICPASARAQDYSDEPAPAHIAFVEGDATLTREGERDAADAGVPFLPGDVVRTDRGRLELMFPDGSVIDIDEYSTFELLSPTLGRLSDGRLLATIVGIASRRAAANFAIDTPLASASMLGPGQYRLSLLGAPAGTRAAFEVIRGTGTLNNERGTTTLRAGEQSLADDGAAPTYARSFNSARYDAFDQWAASLQSERTSGRSTQYLPEDLRAYSGVLDRSGSWDYESSYGYVWYPSVDADWRPYEDGYWSSVPAYGWTWIGAGAWSWPTHHYGRWGYQRSRWFWIPDRHWGAAWVSWGAAPGYVSWCPLGYDNRAVFSLSMSTGTRWGSGWSILSRNDFGRSRWNARRYSVRSLPDRTPFVTQSAPPIAPRRGGDSRRVVGNGGNADRTNSRATSGSAVPRGPSSGGPGSSGFPDRGRVGDRPGDRPDDRRGAPVAQSRDERATSGARSGSGREMSSQPSAPGRPADPTGPRAVPRGSAPPVIYSSPSAPGRDAVPPRDDRRTMRDDRGARSGATRSEATHSPESAASAPPTPGTPAAPAAPSGSARPRYREGAPAAASPPPSPPPSAGDSGPSSGARESRRSQRAESAPARSSEPASHERRASGGGQSSGGGQPSSGGQSQDNGGHARARRR